MHIKHKEKTTEADNRHSLVTSVASSVSLCYCDTTRAENIRQLVSTRYTPVNLSERRKFPQADGLRLRVPAMTKANNNYINGDTVML